MDLRATHSEEMTFIKFFIFIFIFKLPGKRPLGWTVQAKVDIYLWLGPASYTHHIMDNLPVGYETEIPSSASSGHSMVPSPACLRYKSETLFILHNSNGRGLIKKQVVPESSNSEGWKISV